MQVELAETLAGPGGKACNGLQEERKASMAAGVLERGLLRKAFTVESQVCCIRISGEEWLLVEHPIDISVH